MTAISNAPRAKGPKTIEERILDKVTEFMKDHEARAQAFEVDIKNARQLGQQDIVEELSREVPFYQGVADWIRTRLPQKPVAK